jgi:uncharacterized membrane protein
MTKNKPPKFLSLFIIYGILYVFIEVLWRAISSYSGDIGMMALSEVYNRKSLVGYTSLWMFFIGSFAGLGLGYIQEFKWIKHKINDFWKSIIGACLILLIEFLSGCILNIGLGMNIWDYSTLPFNILGQVCLLFGILWFFLTPFAFWFDTFIDWCLFDEVKTIVPLWKRYLNCLMFWKKYK